LQKRTLNYKTKQQNCNEKLSEIGKGSYHTFTFTTFNACYKVSNTCFFIRKFGIRLGYAL